jgi:tRNA A-37 threonylcarbamoyl transferase component Bud32
VPIQPGTRLGAYEVKSLIGQGAMGMVYLASHEALDRTAAVKVMLALGDDPIAVGRFRREGRAIALLRHPNIVTVYDYGEHEGAPYMIEEYIAGGSLAARLKRGKPERADAIHLLRGMAAGLDYAHHRGVVHRDVKPANVLMAADDQPVLADFGLARVEQQATMTASGVATGTPAYMAPEQITDEGEIGPATDLYALATVAYEMLTGRFPHEADSVMKLLMSKLRDDPTPPSERDPSLPRRVDSVLLRGLAREPAARWKSCSMMVEALAAVLEPKADLFATTQPIRLGGVGGWWGDRKRRWRDEAWLGLTLVGVLTLVAVFIVVPRLHPAPSAPGTGGPTVVPCPAVSPSPQLTASPNPATTGEPVTYTASGFQTGDPLFIVIDGAGDCTNPTAGAKVFNSSSYTDPMQTEPSPLPASVTPGDYQVRACNQRPGEPPINCVQVPFSVVAAPTPSPAETPSPSASPSPS